MSKENEIVVDVEVEIESTEAEQYRTKVVEILIQAMNTEHTTPDEMVALAAIGATIDKLLDF